MELGNRRKVSSFSIRSAAPEDYEDISTVWTESGLPVSAGGRDCEEAFIRQLQEFPDLYLVAVEGPEIVGVILGTHDHRKGWINRLAVRPANQRHGIAAALVSACDAAIRAKGIEIVSALVDPENRGSCKLFEELGYVTDIEVRYFRKLSRPEV